MTGFQVALFTSIIAFIYFSCPLASAANIRDWKGGLNPDGSKKTLGEGLYRTVIFCMCYFGFLGLSFSLLGFIDLFGYIPGWFTQIGWESLGWASIVTSGIAIAYFLPFTLAEFAHWIYPKISRGGYLGYVFAVGMVFTTIFVAYFTSLSLLSGLGLIKLLF